MKKFCFMCESFQDLSQSCLDEDRFFDNFLRYLNMELNKENYHRVANEIFNKEKEIIQKLKDFCNYNLNSSFADLDLSSKTVLSILKKRRLI